MKKAAIKTKPFNTQRSIEKVSLKQDVAKIYTILSDNKVYSWSNRIERVGVIRAGIPYETIELIGKKLNNPVKRVLELMGIPQTTYNKKKNEHSLLDSRNSELIILINELIDFGIDVFNNEEEKFQRWLKKPNLSMGGITPESMLDTITGINEVRNCLNRIEFGNFA
jgi:putative toxin-antitoxin system antitoxin component (TIGR02293 family)